MSSRLFLLEPLGELTVFPLLWALVTRKPHHPSPSFQARQPVHTHVAGVICDWEIERSCGREGKFCKGGSWETQKTQGPAELDVQNDSEVHRRVMRFCGYFNLVLYAYRSRLVTLKECLKNVCNQTEQGHNLYLRSTSTLLLR